MPAVDYGNIKDQVRAGIDVENTDFGYQYPNGLNLRPGSHEGSIHDFLRDRIMERARAAHEALAARRSSWDAIDEKLNVFIPLDEEEKRQQEKDSRRPVSVVVPTLYANLQTLCTYSMTAFFGNAPAWPMRSRKPEQALGVIKLEMYLEWQRKRQRMLSAINTQIRDAYAYGFGVVTPTWVRELGFKTTRRPKGFWNALAGAFFQTGWQRSSEACVNFEGNRLDAINPRHYLPDPNTPIHEPDRAEFIGWIQRTNSLDLLSREQNDKAGLFNCRYVRESRYNRSCLFEHRTTGREDDVPEHPEDPLNVVDVIWLHVKLIPREWKLAPRDYPERWLFALAGDRYVIQATPLGLNHNRAPVAVAAPDTDGRAVSPISKVETGFGLSTHIDKWFSAHAENRNRAIFNQFVYDPSVINSADVRNPKAGGLIRTRKAMWGRDIKTAIMQLPVTDVTANHLQEVGIATELVQRSMGTVDIVQGFVGGGERRSATEMRGAREAALSRLQYSTQIIAEQSHGRIGELMASQSQQFMEEEIYLDVVGRWDSFLAEEYGITDYAQVTPWDIMVDYDVDVLDGSIPNGDYADIWLQMYQMITSNPELSMRYDIDKIFLHIARMTGANDIYSFRIPDLRLRMMAQEQVDAEVQKGNFVPVEDVADA